MSFGFGQGSQKGLLVEIKKKKEGGKNKRKNSSILNQRIRGGKKGQKTSCWKWGGGSNLGRSRD